MSNGIESRGGQNHAEWRPPERPKTARDRTIDKIVADRESHQRDLETSNLVRAAIEKTRQKALKVALASEGGNIDSAQLSEDRKEARASSEALKSFEEAREVVGRVKDSSQQQEVLSRLGGSSGVEAAKQNWLADNFRRWLSVVRRERVVNEQENQKKKAA